MRRAVLAVLGMLVFGTGAWGAEGGSAVLLGTVRDENHGGLSGIQVQVFLDGFPLASTRSDSLGSYRLAFPWIPGADSTVLATWMAETGGLVPAAAVLRESATAKRLGLWGTTIPRVAAPAESVHDVVLRTRAAAGRRDAASDTTVSAPGSEADPAPRTEGGSETGSGLGPKKEPGTGIDPANSPGSTRAR